MGLVTTLGELLPAAAERDADGTAIRDQGASISWAEAATRAATMASALVEAGVMVGHRVGVCHRKSADAFLAMHAVVQCGAVAVPLDPSASVAYLASVCELAELSVVLTHGPCRPLVAELAEVAGLRTVIGVSDEYLAGLEASSPVIVDGDRPAYLITTSGSTGRPKSICHTHSSAMAYVRFMRSAYDFGSHDRISDIAPNHFDISTLALWVGPSVGATNVVVPEPYQMLPASLAQLTDDEQISVWFSVPYLLTQLLSRGDIEKRDLSKLRWVLFGGEVFPPGLLSRLMAMMPAARFSNVYGPAEVNACTIHHLPGPPVGQEPVPIGRPVGETEVQVIDVEADPTRPAAVDEQGEIWVKAATMMQGYWRRPDLTEQAVVELADGRWYRTGDQGWQRGDGQLVFAGRVDHQVKVRGHRVELEAIEAALEDADGIDNGVAAVARSADGGDVIIAGLVTVAGHEIDPDQLRQALADRLPGYSLPSTFVPIGSLPTTGSGKLDRRALRAMLVDQYHSEGEADV